MSSIIINQFIYYIKIDHYKSIEFIAKKIYIITDENCKQWWPKLSMDKTFSFIKLISKTLIVNDDGTVYVKKYFDLNAIKTQCNKNLVSDSQPDTK